LDGLINECRDVKDMRCIVFVERKIATKVLAYFLSSIAMFASSLQFRSLAGKTEGMDSMTRKLQQEAVQSFRAGHVNVLVSTNVAEEGLDIQSCCLVIRFDLPKTPSSLIQSRGRARCKGSTYVYLVERGNNDQFERLQLLKWKESLMKEQALSRIERMESVGSPQTQGPEMFQIETTGASISTPYSISLLHQYCGRLPRDSFYTPAPKFTYTTENSGDIRCSIVLPPESLIKTVKGWACSTRNGAKQSACFEACKQLHEAGALSDLFLINSDDPENDDMGFLAADDDDTPAGKAQQELHPLFVPDVFQGSWSQASSCVTLYGYTIKFVPKPSDRSYANFRLFVESDLGEEVVNSLLQLELQSQRVVEAQCSSAGKLEFEPDQVSSIYLSIYSQQLCMHTLWGLIFL
jgi:endoribonuclease Dicer